MKKNAHLMVGFLAFLCLSGQSPRKEVLEITTLESGKRELKAEVQEVKKEAQRKSAAQRARECTGLAIEVPKSAAKKAIEAEIAQFAEE